MPKIPGLNRLPDMNGRITYSSSGFGFNDRGLINDVVNPLRRATSSLLDKNLNKVSSLLPGELRGLIPNGTTILRGIENFGAIGGISASSAPQSTLSDMKARSDPLFQMDWNVIMPNIEGNTLSYAYVEEVQLPMAHNDADGVFRSGSMNYYAKYNDIGAVSINFYEDRLLTATKYLQQWRGLIQTRDGTFNYPSKYKKFIIVQPKDAKGNILGTFVLHGCFPTNIQNYPFTSANSERVIVTAEFSVDNMVIDVFGNETGPSTSNASASNPISGFNIENLLSGLPKISSIGNMANSIASRFGGNFFS